MKLRAIDHVTLQVSDIDASMHYYEDVFGLSCTPLRTGNGRSMKLESAEVHFFMEENPGLDADTICRQHISFQVESLMSIFEEMDRKGVRYELGEYTGFRTCNYRCCEWRDPDGIRVECVEHTPAR